LDRIIRAVSKDGLVRIRAVDTRDMVERARLIHNMSNTATAALGRVLSAVSLMGDDLKVEDGSVTLQIKGNGPLGAVLAVSDSEGYVRGYLQNPSVELPPREDGKIDVGGGVGSEGYLSVIRDLNLKEPYTGQVQLVSGEIAEDVTRYFAESEQIPTVCALGVLMGTGRHVIQAGGFILQLLPPADEEAIERVEKNIAKLPSFTTMRQMGMSLEDIIYAVLEGFRPELLGEHEVGYRCNCSREKVERALVSLGEELESIIEDENETKVTCQFCDNVYRFSKQELMGLLKNSRP